MSIIGAPFGVFLIIVGIVCAAVGGRRRVVVNNVVQVASTPGPSILQANIPDDSGKPRRIEPPMAPAERFIDVTPQAAPVFSRNGYSYDRIKWEALVKYDNDIARLVNTLAPYGEKYVDELAAAYLAINDKEYLPIIIKKILGTAQQDAAASARSV